MKKVFTWLGKHKLLVLIAAAAIAAAVIVPRLTKKSDSEFLEVQLEKHDLFTYSTFVGTVQADSDCTIIPKVSSTVASVLVKEGDTVAKGQTIALLDDTAARYQIALKQASMNQSGISNYYNIRDAETAYLNYKAALEAGLNSSMVSAGRSLDSANLAVNNAQEKYDSAMSSADSAVSAAKSRLENAGSVMEAAKAALLPEEEAARITEAYTLANQEKEFAKASLADAVTKQELAKLAWEAEAEGTPEKEEKQKEWSKAVEEETAAQQTLDEKEAALQPVKSEYDVLTSLNDAYAHAVTEYEAAKAALSSAKAARSETEDSLESALEASEHELAAARISYDSAALVVQQQLQNYEDTIAKIKANSADRTGQVEMSHLQDALQDYVLVAPVSGTITKLSIQEGATLAANTAAAVISGLDTMVVKVKIDEYSVMSTEVGMPVKIYLDAVKAIYDGTIRYISNTAEETSGVSYYNAEVTFTPDEKIRPGMSTEVRLLKVNEPDADCLYAFAVQYRPDGSTYVYVKSGEDKEERDVTVGPSDGEYVQILSGLSAEETVLAPYPENPYKYGSEITIG